MIQQLDVHQLAGRLDFSGNGLIIAAGLDLPGRMVVATDDGRGVLEQGVLDDLPRENHSLSQSALEQDFGGEQGISAVEKQNHEGLPGAPGQQGGQMIGHFPAVIQHLARL